MLTRGVRARREAGVQRSTRTCEPWRGHVDRIDSQTMDGRKRTQHASGATLAGDPEKYFRARTNTRDAAQMLIRTPRTEHGETPTVRTATGELAEELDEHRPGLEPEPAVGPRDDRTCERKRDLMAQSVQPEGTGQRGRPCRPVRRCR